MSPVSPSGGPAGPARPAECGVDPQRRRCVLFVSLESSLEPRRKRLFLSTVSPSCEETLPAAGSLQQPEGERRLRTLEVPAAELHRKRLGPSPGARRLLQPLPFARREGRGLPLSLKNYSALQGGTPH
ncbi:hypothetical protein TGCAST_389710 [Toxoplasma gondii CAST]|uniref:Uncharacterized protein n=1 Tax=Toxoplasma gondii CAST TaxID=943122 RepID=A0A3R8AH86_TOXGO|nr:hypothetical protein TGCAST_389710 [Toxoplasma gondii CAST]